MPAYFPPAPLNRATTSDPGVSNDSSQGFSVGSAWFNSSTGVKWKCYSNAAGAAVWLQEDYADHPGYTVGNWYSPIAGSSNAGTAPGANSARFMPWIPKYTFTISDLGVRVSTNGSSNSQFAVYAANTTTRYPTGSQLVATANVANNGGSATNIHGTASLQVLGGKLYWLGVNQNDGSVVYGSVVTGNMYAAVIIGSATQANAGYNANITGLSTPLTFGTWGDLTGATFTEAASTVGNALVQFKVGSVP